MWETKIIAERLGIKEMDLIDAWDFRVGRKENILNIKKNYGMNTPGRFISTPYRKLEGVITKMEKGQFRCLWLKHTKKTLTKLTKVLKKRKFVFYKNKYDLYLKIKEDNERFFIGRYSWFIPFILKYGFISYYNYDYGEPVLFKGKFIILGNKQPRALRNCCLFLTV